MEQPPIEPRAVSVTRLHQHESESRNDGRNDGRNDSENNREDESSNEKQIETPSLLILSDVFLDRSEVFDRLRALLTKHNEDAVPPSFLLCGDFVSSEYSMDSAGIRRLQRLFTDLADLIASFPRLIEHSNFIFVPGPRDVGTNGLFPRESVGATLPVLFRRFQSSFHSQFKMFFINIQIIFTSLVILADSD